MSAFPTYGPEDIAALDEQADAILAVFGARGYTRHEPSMLQPAQIFVDRSGEEIRRRTFELTDPSGRELCLRPDLTIPTCHMAGAKRQSLSGAALLSRTGVSSSRRAAARRSFIKPVRNCLACKIVLQAKPKS